MPEPLRDGRSLLRSLESWNPRSRRHAGAEVMKLTEKELVDLQAQSTERYRRSRRRRLQACAALALLPVLMRWMTVWLASQRAIAPQTWLPAACWFFGILALSLTAAVVWLPPRPLAAELTDCDTPGLLLPWILEQLAHADDLVTVASLSRTARRLLTALESEDFGTLTIEQRRGLRKLLSSPYADVRGTQAAMRVIAAIGDSHSIAVLERLAADLTTPRSRREAISDFLNSDVAASCGLIPAGKILAVRAAARECLPILYETVRLGGHPDTLLRPAGAQPAANTLLRAVHASSSPDELLRASSAGGRLPGSQMEARPEQIVRLTGTSE